MADNFDVTLVKGDTARWSYFFLGLTSGVTFNFSGTTVYMQVRNGYSPATLVASYTKHVPEGTVLSFPDGLTGGLGVGSGTTGGTCNFCIGYSFTNELTADRMCKYDFKVLDTNNTLTTLLRGNLQVLPEVTDI
jgi:hypothetical protein